MAVHLEIIETSLIYAFKASSAVQSVSCRERKQVRLVNPSQKSRNQINHVHATMDLVYTEAHMSL